jgi:hypothetical protein
MDVFALRDKVVSDYRRYIESFVRIRDTKIEAFVRSEFESGVLWPDPILQLNPAYEPGLTVDRLVDRGTLRPETAKFFRKHDGTPLRLYRHQEEAIAVASKLEPYVVTTGTGSGKSLTYLIPIYDSIVRNQPEKKGVRAIIVYPMNALINSQWDALKTYRDRFFPDSPVKFDRYTGQEQGAARQRIQEEQPHILLTNYVMLEYMLLRETERVFTSAATSHLQFLVLDELHTYRGRQGADVAMLLRRLRERSGNPKLLHIGTSATMSTEGKRDARRAAVASVASKLFGNQVKPESVIDETLQPAIKTPVPSDGGPLRAAIEMPTPKNMSEFVASPLAAWMERCFGLAEEDGRLVRKSPITYVEGIQALSKASALPLETCNQKLKAMLEAGNLFKNESGEPLFAFRLHQFLAAGGTVYATLDPPAKRKMSLEGQYYAGGDDGEQLLYPLVFCRECGQDYYMANLREGLSHYLTPRTPIFSAEDEDQNVIPGYAALNRDLDDDADLWDAARESELPDHWWEQRKTGPRIKRDFKPHVPRALVVRGNGEAGEKGTDGVKVWFQPAPFLVCLRCGVAFDRREKNDFRKLTRLSHTGRSTATTLVSGSAIVQLRSDANVSEQARKLLSFTDNRQDASLQAGHFNDFIQVALIRSAVYKALNRAGSLDHAQLTPAAFKALNIRQEAYAKAPSDVDPGKRNNENAMMRLLDYRLYEDLRRGWRVIQPNLEQCGLLTIEYPGLEPLCENDALWTRHPVLQSATPQTRFKAVKAFLDYLRKEMALDARVLDPTEEWELRQRVQQSLRDPWAFDNDDVIRQSTLFVLPGNAGPEGPRDRSTGEISLLARFLRSKRTWDTHTDVPANEWEQFLGTIVEVLRGNFLLVTKTHARKPAIQLLASSIRWTKGTGKPPEPDPIRSRWMRSARDKDFEGKANAFFAELYRETARLMAGVEGGAHTGQIPADIREQREKEFRNGDLSALFCSPTMELGIDIRDLNMVHMRNVPPTPANYAQRSGRAGRGGQAALVVAFCSEGSSHDQYFFRQPALMVAGAVAPPRLELGNQELVRAHLHSVWMAHAGLSLSNSMTGVLDLNALGLPLLPNIQLNASLSDAKLTALKAECLHILAACAEEVTSAIWFTPVWLDQVLKDAPQKFNSAMDRWRELFTSAVAQRNQARKIIDDHSAKKDDQRRAAGAEAEAKHEIALLLNQAEQTESDFYPYRYLASEGFLPGYSFPRLPLRALLETEKATHIIDRPRFLGLSEFGPRNILYHEGRKYRLIRCVLPIAGIEARMRKAKFCLMCGYVHENVGADICDHCKVNFNAETSDFVPWLFEMTTVKGKRVERITCDEEERTREGYELSLQYRFSAGTDGQSIFDKARTTLSGGEALAEFVVAPQADLWRVNRRWKRSDSRGFTLETTTGYWAQKPGEDGPKDIESNQVMTGVQPFVHDTRNLLLFKADASPFKDRGEDFLASISYALQRGMQILFQVEEQEIAVARIGQKDERRILYWESAEGGNGIWPRLLHEPKVLSQVAREALKICHFDPDTGSDLADRDACSRACYRCLLSYSNQMDHSRLDRQLIRDYLLKLVQAVTSAVAKGRSYEEQYVWLMEKHDPKSGLEAELLQALFESRRRLPDRAQYRPEPRVYCEADFYFERDGLKGVAIFVDGPSHDEPTQRKKDAEERTKLDNLGYRALVIRYDRSIQEQIAENPDVFGPGAKSTPKQPDPLRERYVATVKAYQTLVNQKYRAELSPSERESLTDLERALDEMDKLYYEKLLQHLQTLVETKEAGS